ncbi:hypothetical protein L1887_09288 [Cichorium endivia]|nr:hypothetical protein L1887_09288 [Cichorium endivia]
MKGAFFIEGSSLCLCGTFLLLKDFFIGFWFDPKREKLYMPIKQFFHLILVFLFNSFSKQTLCVPMIIFESRSLLSLFSRQTGSGNLALVSFRPTQCGVMVDVERVTNPTDVNQEFYSYYATKFGLLRGSGQPKKASLDNYPC